MVHWYVHLKMAERIVNFYFTRFFNIYEKAKLQRWL